VIIERCVMIYDRVESCDSRTVIATHRAEVAVECQQPLHNCYFADDPHIEQPYIAEL
jgi:hypothetical protein